MGKPEWEWFSNPIWEQIRECQDVFAGVFAYGRWRFNSPQAEKLLRLHPENILDTNSLPTSTGIYGWLKVIGRLKPGVSPRQATARLKTLAPEIFKVTLPWHWSLDDQDFISSATSICSPPQTVNRICARTLVRRWAY